jgi:uncharacterized protein (TIGR03435 family)
MESDRFDLVAKSSTSADQDDLRRMLQNLLAERCRLSAHRETREMQLYELIVKDASKLHPLKDGRNPTLKDLEAVGATRELNDRDRLKDGVGLQNFHGTMELFCSRISGSKDVLRPVLNKTGLEGSYLIALKWYGGDYKQELEARFGLKLVPTKGPIQVLTIDKIEHPTAN